MPSAWEKYFDDYKVGEIIPMGSRTITEADVVSFAALSGDWHSVHTDALFAEKSVFGRRIAHGMLTLTIASGLMFRGGIASDASMAFLGIRQWNFKAPVFIGDTITLRIQVKEARPTSKGDRGIITYACQIVNLTRGGEVSNEGDWVQMYARRPAAR